MKDRLAERLLYKTMDWDTEILGEELSFLQDMSYYRYDYYEQFIPGVRYLGSLVRWLGQFDTKEEQDLMYNYVKNNLIYITREQIINLVYLSFSTIINPFIIDETSKILKIESFKVNKIINDDEYDKQKRRTLFIGLSDGSHIDVLRRSAELNNEQVLTSYSVSDEKIKELIKDLKKDLNEVNTFKNLILVDDFTASGTSYIRKEEGEFKGKLTKILPWLQAHCERDDLFEKNVNIVLLFYIATEDSLSYLEKIIGDYQKKIGSNFIFLIDSVQKIGNSVKFNQGKESQVFEILTKDKYFDKKIIDSSYKKGKHKIPQLGYNECALPLILFHNTPNNSLPILWLNCDTKKETFKGLFPRITRHKDEQYDESI